MSRTIAQRKNGEGFPKAGELIEFRSQHELTLQDRRILNLLIENAGPHIASERWHRIAMTAIRGSHTDRRQLAARICAAGLVEPAWLN